MRNRNQSIFLKPLTVLAILVVNPLTLLAQDSDIEEMIIVGKYLSVDKAYSLKTPTPIINVPQSLSITTAAQIVQQGFDSVSDIVLYTPGVNQSQGEGHRDAIVFRGVRSTADFYIDGVRDDVQYYRSLYNLEQVEILRGPNALFFGRGGTGGIFNRVTKKAVIGENFGGYLGSVDSFGATAVHLDRNYTVNDTVAIRINTFYEGLDNHRDFFDGDRFAINPTAFIQLTPETTLNLSYEYVDNQRFIDRGIPSLNGAPAEALEDITFGDPELNTTTLEANIFRATIEHNFNDYLKGNVNLSYGDYDKLYSNFFPINFNEITNIVDIDGYVDTTQRTNFVFSTNLVGELVTGDIYHTIVGGFEYIGTSNDNDRFNAFFDQTLDDVEVFNATRPLSLIGGVGVNASGNATSNDFSVDLNDDTEGDVSVFSFYVQDEIEIAPWLDIILGLRYDSFEITINNIQTLIDTGEADIVSRTDSEVSPRLGFVVKPQENLSIYGSFSESFLPRSGEQFADLPRDQDNTADSAVFDPDTFQNLEVGVKWDYSDRLSFTAALFEVEQSSPQPGDEAGTLVVIDSDVTGFEAQVQGEINDWWYISAGYSFLDGKQVDSESGSETDLRLRELPENTVNLWNQFQVAPQWGLGVGFTYQDDSFADNDNGVTLPSFFRLDVSAFYEINNNIKLQLNIENITNTDYFPNAHTANNITVGAPINAKFSIVGTF